MYYKRYENLRNEKGVRDVDVARSTGIDPTTFSHWKQNKYTPKDDKLSKIAKYFGIPLSELKVEDLSELETLAADMNKPHSVFDKILNAFGLKK